MNFTNPINLDKFYHLKPGWNEMETDGCTWMEGSERWMGMEHGNNGGEDDTKRVFETKVHRRDVGCSWIRMISYFLFQSNLFGGSLKCGGPLTHPF